MFDRQGTDSPCLFKVRRKLEVKIERSAEDMAIDDSKCKNPPQVS